MHAALWVSKTGLSAQDAKMSSISNNLANVNTVGFKRDRVAFEDLFYQVQRQPGAQQDQQNLAPIGIQMGNGVRVVGTQKVFTSGQFQNTNQELDMAVVGAGFFGVERPDGETAYTRNGQWHRNAEGQLVNADGLPMVPQIQIPDNVTKISIGTDGTVSASLPGQQENVELGRITLTNFANPAGLEALGGNLYRATGASGEPIEGVPGEEAMGAVKQFTLESSNVNVVEEMVDMITTQRAYEMNAKVVSSADQMLKFVTQAL
ncbi:MULTISPECIES: lateral flagellar basal-body rod protein LfgG [unclassified Aeromonas]|uniref:lateral flagellar basal-body rod protein LfgG n=1 Tax=unclassified Aeromonas TaxID=257493 RepID=UPI00084AFCC8|nr:MULTISPECIES: lateral flagellar basal-body rod protein LfgG [unclassified Aeromonas]OEC56371.1 flagellar basal-body rod protein FlgG [Aeromonas sp. ANNP30]OEC65951.1 flagellar basal-body rod protein FlgG [Aeromonas sp. ANP5]